MSDLTKDAIAREIEAKKRKLEELKQRRLNRPAITAAAAANNTTHNAVASVVDVLGTVNSLILSSPLPSQPPSSPSPLAPSSHATDPSPARAAPPTRRVLSAVTQPHIVIPAADVIRYDSATQTDTADAPAPVTADGGFNEQIRRERDDLRIREVELMNVLAAIKQQNAQPQTPQRTSHTQTVDDTQLRSFLSRASLLVERALASSVRYDFMIDYSRSETVSATAPHNSQTPLTLAETLSSPSLTGRKPVSAIDYHPKYPELIVAAYADGASDDPTDDDDSGASAAGVLLVWNAHMSGRPEYVFTCDSAVMSVMWHPTAATVMIGGTQSGALLQWDSRHKAIPVHRTALTASHTAPIHIVTTLIGINGAVSTLTVSTDGRVAVWSENNWHTPHLTLQLTVSTAPKSDVTVTTIALPPTHTHTHTFVAGTDEGHIHRVQLYGKTVITESVMGAHAAPITALSYHPITALTSAPPPCQNAFVWSASYDWTVKLWQSNTSQLTLIHTFESAKDYVTDIALHPIHPAVFVTADATGQVDVWNLLISWDKPVFTSNINANTSTTATPQPSAANASGIPPSSSPLTSATSDGSVIGGIGSAGVTRLRWNGDGRVLAVGVSDGRILLYTITDDIARPTEQELDMTWEAIQQRANSAVNVAATLNGTSPKLLG